MYWGVRGDHCYIFGESVFSYYSFGIYILVIVRYG